MSQSFTEDPFGRWGDDADDSAKLVGREVIGVLGKHYRVLDIRRGGMGEVYICEYADELDRPRVALKTFQKRLILDRRSRIAFLREASIWIRLSGLPNILPASGIEVIDGRPFVRMPAIEPKPGQLLSLRERIEQGPLAGIEAATIAFQVARGLTEAEQKLPGLVHGDLKPDNLLYGAKDIFVSDFGLARAIGDDVQAGSTWAYQAPEVWATEGQATPASDIYAFGVTLYEMLTGSSPFRATTREEWSKAHQVAPISAPSDFRAEGVEAEMMTLAMDCMAREPDDRPDSFAAIAKIISDAINEHDPVAAVMMLVDAMRAKEFHTVVQKEIMPEMIRTLTELGASDLALEELESLPDELVHGQIATLYGTALSLQNRDEEAIPMFEQALAEELTEKQRIHTQSEYGLSLKRVGRYDEAIEVFQSLVPLLPELDLAGAVSNLATVYLAKGDFRGAVEALEPFVRKHQGDAHSWANLGLAYIGLERWENARDAMQKAIRLAPQDASLLVHLARIMLVGFRNVMQARQTLMLAFEQGYDSGEWYTLLQACHLLLGEKENAAVLRDALKERADADIVDRLTEKATDLAYDVAGESRDGKDRPAARADEPGELPPQDEDEFLAHSGQHEPSPGFQMPFVNYRSYADGSAGFDFYHDPEAPNFVDLLVEGWGRIERDPRIAKFNAQFRGTPAYFTRCPECELEIVTNRQPGARLRCRQCETVHETAPTERPERRALIEAAERRLGKVIEELEAVCHLLFVWPSSADLVEWLEEICISMNFRKVEDPKRAYQSMEASGVTAWEVDADQPMFAVSSRPAPLRIYRGATPPVVSTLLSELRSVDNKVRTMSTDFVPDSLEPIAILVEGREHELEQMARQAVVESPDDLSAHQFLVEVLRGQGKFDEALARATDSANRWPGNAAAWQSLGMIQLRLDKTNDAIESLRRCLDLDPVDRHSMIALAAALRNNGDEAAAREWDSKAQALGGFGF